MEKLEIQRHALEDIRNLLGRFVRNEISHAEFMTTYGKLFAPFDPPDINTEGLSLDERNRLNVFIIIMGGWFGENEELIPKRSNWQYGKDTEPYSWIDAPAYRKWIENITSQAGIVV